MKTNKEERNGRQIDSTLPPGSAYQGRFNMSFSDARLRRRCAKILRQISAGKHLNLDELVARITAWRNREIILLPFNMPAGTPCGLWLSLNDKDVIVYDENTSILHQKHIIAHELGHIAFDHNKDEDSAIDNQVARDLFPSFNPELIIKTLGRTHYSSKVEREAETFATIAIQSFPKSDENPKEGDAATENFTWTVDQAANYAVERLKMALEGTC